MGNGVKIEANYFLVQWNQGIDEARKFHIVKIRGQTVAF
jgi:hypothetical protein